MIVVIVQSLAVTTASFSCNVQALHDSSCSIKRSCRWRRPSSGVQMLHNSAATFMLSVSISSSEGSREAVPGFSKLHRVVFSFFVSAPECRCNGEVDLGSKALDDVLYRAQLELFPEPLLVGGIVVVTPPSSTSFYVRVPECTLMLAYMLMAGGGNVIWRRLRAAQCIVPVGVCLQSRV